LERSASRAALEPVSVAEGQLPLSSRSRSAQFGKGGRWWTLGAMCVCMFMIFLDATIVNVALPSIQRDLHARISDLQWVLNAYTLVVGVLLVTGGRFGDLFGRKIVVLSGVAVFTLGSAVGGFSQDIHFLIGARALQGLGGAMLLPGTLSIIAHTFDGPERGMAIGIWSGVSSVAIALGPVLGGILVEKATWQSIFYINIPIGIAALIVGWITVEESRDTTASQRVDIPGVLVISLSLLALSLAFIQGNERGWTSGYIVSLMIGGFLLLFAFVAVEVRSRNPLLDLHFFRSPTFSGANFAAFTSTFGMFAYFFFITLYLQDVLGYSALQTGLRLLPQTLLVAVTAPIAGKLTDRLGPKLPLVGGQLLLVLSLLLATRLGVNSGEGELLPVFALNGIGLGLINTPISAAVVGAISRHRSGTASGVMNTMRQVGGTLGVAALGALFTHQVTSHFVARSAELNVDQATARTLGPIVASTGAQAVSGLPAGAAVHAVDVAKAVFVKGLDETLYVNAAVVLLGAIAAALWVHGGSAPSASPVEAESLQVSVIEAL
jgi:EmrB/QacA subfamily drug resistance transporter